MIMSLATERTKQAEADMKKNWAKRTPIRLKEQEERHKANQKANIAGERQHLIAAGELKKRKRKMARG